MILIVYLILANVLGGTSWINNKILQEKNAERRPVKVKEYVMNLDLPANERWNDIAADFKDKTQDMVNYLTQFIPTWTIPIVEDIGHSIEKFFPEEYVDEMKGFAKATGIDEGMVVILNMAYQLSSLGQNCSTDNTTGPGCDDDGPPGLCTSTVFNGMDDKIYLARNLDWNFPDTLLDCVINVDYQAKNNTVYKGTTLAGFVGIMNGVRPGGYAVSMNARNHGGNILPNFFELLAVGARTPTQNLRHTLATEQSYDAAVSKLKADRLANDVYYIVGGTKKDEGVVISRGRNMDVDAWAVNSSEVNGWYRLQTNYDHWEPVPDSDNRRDPGNENMQKVGQKHANLTSIWSDVLTIWPTYNPHTDWTSLLCPETGQLDTFTWRD